MMHFVTPQLKVEVHTTLSRISNFAFPLLTVTARDIPRMPTSQETSPVARPADSADPPQDVRVLCQAAHPSLPVHAQGSTSAAAVFCPPVYTALASPEPRR
jgi:hypothetical protein